MGNRLDWPECPLTTLFGQWRHLRPASATQKMRSFSSRPQAPPADAPRSAPQRTRLQVLRISCSHNTRALPAFVPRVLLKDYALAVLEGIEAILCSPEPPRPLAAISSFVGYVPGSIVLLSFRPSAEDSPIHCPIGPVIDVVSGSRVGSSGERVSRQ